MVGTSPAVTKAYSDEIEPLFAVMPALVVGIHVFLAAFSAKDVDGRDKPGHDSK